ncbi:hypothetical protein Nepgr_000919 [Nepenthes gracilis]|uniref:GATA transcription factor n=1 Tax=Nepenthes gracilis TaxID=150966 RepID=A0AAD3P576_NEPGR|nr:hypothetical protein Nepgr_000919 [Nepenthes gracilis]
MEAPEFGYCSQQFAQEKRQSEAKTGDHFTVEDLLDFSNDDGIINDGAFDSITVNSTDSSTVTVLDSCNSSFTGANPHLVHVGCDIGCQNFADMHFSSDLCVPCDDLAELEWLSNFVEESFSSKDLQKLHLVSGIKTRPDEGSETRDFQPDPTQSCDNAIVANEYSDKSPIFGQETPVPAKARSKRSRAAACSWASRLLVLSPKSQTSSSHAEPDVTPTVGPKPVTKPAANKKGAGTGSAVAAVPNTEGRRCLHCATDKTPQWRSGPMGPKTLCNACGVRYKSGRLVPEYRPAASPTFVLTKHSNSHRKVVEIRRQKELLRQHQLEQQQHQIIRANLMFDGSNHDDYLVQQQIGPGFGQLI